MRGKSEHYTSFSSRLEVFSQSYNVFLKCLSFRLSTEWPTVARAVEQKSWSVWKGRHFIILDTCDMIFFFLFYAMTLKYHLIKLVKSLTAGGQQTVKELQNFTEKTAPHWKLKMILKIPTVPERPSVMNTLPNTVHKLYRSRGRMCEKAAEHACQILRIRISPVHETSLLIAVFLSYCRRISLPWKHLEPVSSVFVSLKQVEAKAERVTAATCWVPAGEKVYMLDTRGWRELRVE